MDAPLPLTSFSLLWCPCAVILSCRWPLMPLLLFALFLVLFCPLFYSALDRVLSLTLFAFGILLSFVPSCIWPPAAQESYLLYPPNLIFFLKSLVWSSLVCGQSKSPHANWLFLPRVVSFYPCCPRVVSFYPWCPSALGDDMSLLLTCPCCLPAQSTLLLMTPFCS